MLKQKSACAGKHRRLVKSQRLRTGCSITQPLTGITFSQFWAVDHAQYILAGNLRALGLLGNVVGAVAVGSWVVCQSQGWHCCGNGQYGGGDQMTCIHGKSPLGTLKTVAAALLRWHESYFTQGRMTRQRHAHYKFVILKSALPFYTCGHVCLRKAKLSP